MNKKQKKYFREYRRAQREKQRIINTSKFRIDEMTRQFKWEKPNGSEKFFKGKATRNIVKIWTKALKLRDFTSGGIHNKITDDEFKSLKKRKATGLKKDIKLITKKYGDKTKSTFNLEKMKKLKNLARQNAGMGVPRSKSVAMAGDFISRPIYPSVIKKGLKARLKSLKNESSVKTFFNDLNITSMALAKAGGIDGRAYHYWNNLTATQRYNIEHYGDSQGRTPDDVEGDGIGVKKMAKPTGFFIKSGKTIIRLTPIPSYTKVKGGYLLSNYSKKAFFIWVK